MSELSQHAVIQAARSENILDAALAYHKAGLCVIPLKGKRPTLDSWKAYQTKQPTQAEITAWHRAGLLKNVGIVCGAVSGGLVVIDFDGLGAYGAFAAMFPALAQTFTVATGSGKGKHVYLYVEELPATVRAMETVFGNVELRANGSQVAAPPSIDPATGNPYTVDRPLDILRMPDLDDVVRWIELLQAPRREKPPVWRPPRTLPTDGSVNPAVVAAIAARLRQRNHRERGEWLNCACIYPEHHRNGDKHASYGFNTQTGYSYCYVLRDDARQRGVRAAGHRPAATRRADEAISPHRWSLTARAPGHPGLSRRDTATGEGNCRPSPRSRCPTG